MIGCVVLTQGRRPAELAAERLRVGDHQHGGAGQALPELAAELAKVGR